MEHQSYGIVVIWVFLCEWGWCKWKQRTHRWTPYKVKAVDGMIRKLSSFILDTAFYEYFNQSKQPFNPVWFNIADFHLIFPISGVSLQD